MNSGVILTAVFVLLQQETSEQFCGGHRRSAGRRGAFENPPTMPYASL